MVEEIGAIKDMNGVAYVKRLQIVRECLRYLKRSGNM